MNKFGSGARWSMLDNLAQQIFSFAVFFILAKLLAPTQFGLLAIGLMVVFLFKFVVLEIVALPLLRIKTTSDVIYNWTFTYCMLLGLLSTVIVNLFSPVIADYYDQPELVPVLRWLSFSLVLFGAVRCYELKLQREERYKALAIRSIVSVILSGAISILMALNGYGVYALVMQQILLALFALLLLVIQSKWFPKLVFACDEIAEFKNDFHHFAISRALGYVISNLDAFIISAFYGSHWLGIYNFAKRLVSAIYLVVASSLLKVGTTAFSNAGDEVIKINRAYQATLGSTLLFLLPFLTLLSVFSYPLIDLIFGDKWIGAVPFIYSLSLFYAIFSINDVNDVLLMTKGLSKVSTWRRLIQLAITFIGTWVLSNAGAVMLSYVFFIAAFLSLWSAQIPINKLAAVNASKLLAIYLPILLACTIVPALYFIYLSFSAGFGLFSVILIGLLSMAMMFFTYYALIKYCTYFVDVIALIKIKTD